MGTLRVAKKGSDRGCAANGLIGEQGADFVALIPSTASVHVFCNIFSLQLRSLPSSLVERRGARVEEERERRGRRSSVETRVKECRTRLRNE